MPDSTLTLAHFRLIEALAERDVQDYLREQAALRLTSEANRPKHAPLLPADKAA